MKQETQYDCRLAELAAAWFRQAEALDVYLQYEFTGATAAVGREDMLEAVDAMVTRALRLCGASPEREDRWLTLTVDRQPQQVRLVCASSGVCPVELPPLVEQGAVAAVSQLSDIYEITVDWAVRHAPMERAGGATC